VFPLYGCGPAVLLARKWNYLKGFHTKNTANLWFAGREEHKEEGRKGKGIYDAPASTTKTNSVYRHPDGSGNFYLKIKS
jgi:hypothetical protein